MVARPMSRRTISASGATLRSWSANSAVSLRDTDASPVAALSMMRTLVMPSSMNLLEGR